MQAKSKRSPEDLLKAVLHVRRDLRRRLADPEVPADEKARLRARLERGRRQAEQIQRRLNGEPARKEGDP